MFETIQPTIEICDQYSMYIYVFICSFHTFQVMVKMTDVDTRREWMWSRTKFLDRRCIMAEMYDKYEDDEEWNLPKVIQCGLNMPWHW